MLPINNVYALDKDQCSANLDTYIITGDSITTSIQLDPYINPTIDAVNGEGKITLSGTVSQSVYAGASESAFAGKTIGSYFYIDDNINIEDNTNIKDNSNNKIISLEERITKLESLVDSLVAKLNKLDMITVEDCTIII